MAQHLLLADLGAPLMLAGGMMLSLDFFVLAFALSFFFWRAARDHDDGERAARTRAAEAGG